MFFGLICIIIFFVTLPWVWTNALPVSVNVRPAVLGAIPLIIYYLWKKNKSKIKNKSRTKEMFLVLFIFIVWISPTFYNEHPHWSFNQVFSVLVYAIVAYYAALGYVMVTEEDSWKKLWPIAGLFFLISCIASFYVAFGSLIPDTSITTSSGLIYNGLYANVFDEGGKGIRHTMAIVVVLLLALVLHNHKSSSMINGILVFGALYLILYTLSRSAWLAAFMIGFLIIIANTRTLGRNFIKVSAGLLVSFLVMVIISFTYPDKVSWVMSILGDRISDEQSAEGRLWVLSHIFLDTTLSEYISGYDRQWQEKPHNLVLDAMMQSGILGMIGALLVVIYTLILYMKGLLWSNQQNIIIAAFATPAFVRMFTAGSGMPHLVELFGLFVAMTLTHVYRSNQHVPNEKNTVTRKNYEVSILKQEV